MQTNTKIDEILERLHKVQQELEQELDKMLVEKRRQFDYRLQRGKVIFEKNVRQKLKSQRIRTWQYISKAPIIYILSSPLIYGMIFPLFFLDITITLYQQICFRIYGIPRVVRADYLVIDRGQLSYLNTVEKFNCIYCGYGNGLIEYVREVIARTEQYWCPIKHAKRTLAQHDRTQNYFDYGDAENYRLNLEKVRKNWD
ncbi:hypothetical protein [uncultured Cocleimonas sp.]|uniref:hypothetical protein n=1 Tax=uncultured Cocleimonas sp. TaxID=1051587 RepID=UPI0026292DF7|nr:hypothetical protein [uncultured Cocleimonas sp.]